MATRSALADLSYLLSRRNLNGTCSSGNPSPCGRMAAVEPPFQAQRTSLRLSLATLIHYVLSGLHAHGFPPHRCALCNSRGVHEGQVALHKLPVTRTTLPGLLSS